MFDSILGNELSLINFLICIGASFVLGLVVALVHMKTAKTSKNFATTLAILPTLVAMAILLVNGNLGAGVATVGIFSLVRFRSIAGFQCSSRWRSVLRSVPAMLLLRRSLR